jgi:hypothetical protein
MICPACNDYKGWWTNSKGERFLGIQLHGAPNASIAWCECPYCLGTTPHCCEGDQAQPVPKPGYRNASEDEPERTPGYRP